PRANQVASLRLGNLQRQQRFGPERFLDLFVGNELARSAERAALRDHGRVEHRDRLTAAAADRDFLGGPAARRVRDVAERGGQVVLDDHGGGAAGLERRRRGGAA